MLNEHIKGQFSKYIHLSLKTPVFIWKNSQVSHGFCLSFQFHEVCREKPTFPTNLPTRRVEVESNSWFPPHGSKASSQTLVGYRPSNFRPQKDGTVGFL